MTAPKDLTHLDTEGHARMVDVGDKPATARMAVSAGRVAMEAETLRAAMAGDSKKGDVRAVAEIAGVMAGKRTSDLIPPCHPITLSADWSLTLRRTKRSRDTRSGRRRAPRDTPAWRWRR